ncbi:class I SAM-dependent methyltransferase [Megalodesulfovibrio paquesii]
MTDALRFFFAWTSDPLRVASVVPSSQALARVITSEIQCECGPVLELGPGTGVFTRALLARGVAQENLILVEYGQEFAELLRRRYPDADVHCADAARLCRLDEIGQKQPGAVVSGLPLLAMPKRKVYAILRGAFQHLREDGAFYQFTYGFRCPIPRAIRNRLDLQVERLGWVLENFPPAQVYRVTRRKAPIAN